MAKLDRTKMEFYNSLIVLLNYYDKFMIKHNFNKTIAREELFSMFKDYYDWLQNKKG